MERKIKHVAINMSNGDQYKLLPRHKILDDVGEEVSLHHLIEHPQASTTLTWDDMIEHRPGDDEREDVNKWKDEDDEEAGFTKYHGKLICMVKFIESMFVIYDELWEE